jgi:hypothetical protein
VSQNPFCTMFSNDSCSCSFLPSQSAHRARKGFAMGATTKSITGLFANVCGRIVREQTAAGHGTRSAATQGYLLLSLSCLRLHSWRDQFSRLARFSWLDQARDQARWLLKRLGAAGRTTFVGASEYVGIAPEYIGSIASGRVSSPAQVASRAPDRRPAIPRLIAWNPTWLPWPGGTPLTCFAARRLRFRIPLPRDGFR